MYINQIFLGQSLLLSTIVLNDMLFMYLAKLKEKNSQEMIAIMKQLESSIKINQSLNETSSVIYYGDVTDDVDNALHRYTMYTHMYICTVTNTRLPSSSTFTFKK